MTEVTGAEFSPAAPAARHYVSGRFAIQDHAPVARQPSPAPQQEPAKAPDSMTWSPVVVYTQPAPQYVALRPVYVQPGEQAGDVYGNVSKGLDKIRAANVQHQKTLRDLIIFHRPGEAVLSNEAAFDKLDHVRALLTALEDENKTLTMQNRELREQCLSRGIQCDVVHVMHQPAYYMAPADLYSPGF